MSSQIEGTQSTLQDVLQFEIEDQDREFPGPPQGVPVPALPGLVRVVLSFEDPVGPDGPAVETTNG